MRETNWWHAGSILVLGGWISLAGACLGDEPSTGRDQLQNQSNREQNPRSDSDDHVRHHAALGVLLGNSQNGVSVVGIIPGSPAALAGLRLGDVIRHVGDQRISTTQGLTEEIRQYQPGSPIDLTIRRNGERRIVRATLASQESTSPNRHQVNRIAANANDSSLKNNLRRSSGTADLASQRIRTLQQQIARLQQEVDRLMSYQDAQQAEQESMQSEDWGWDGRDNQGHDPALFQ